MACTMTNEELNQYLDGMLPEAEMSSVEQHLLGCKACSARYDSLYQLTRDLRGLQSLKARPGTAERVMTAVAGAGELPVRRPATVLPLPRRRAQPWMMALAAACLVATLGIVSWKSRLPAHHDSDIDMPFARRDNATPAPNGTAPIDEFNKKSPASSSDRAKARRKDDASGFGRDEKQLKEIESKGTETWSSESRTGGQSRGTGDAQDAAATPVDDNTGSSDKGYAQPEPAQSSREERALSAPEPAVVFFASVDPGRLEEVKRGIVGMLDAMVVVEDPGAPAKPATPIAQTGRGEGGGLVSGGLPVNAGEFAAALRDVQGVQAVSTASEEALAMADDEGGGGMPEAVNANEDLEKEFGYVEGKAAGNEEHQPARSDTEETRREQADGGLAAEADRETSGADAENADGRGRLTEAVANGAPPAELKKEHDAAEAGLETDPPIVEEQDDADLADTIDESGTARNLDSCKASNTDDAAAEPVEQPAAAKAEARPEAASLPKPMEAAGAPPMPESLKRLDTALRSLRAGQRLEYQVDGDVIIVTIGDRQWKIFLVEPAEAKTPANPGEN